MPRIESSTAPAWYRLKWPSQSSAASWDHPEQRRGPTRATRCKHLCQRHGTGFTAEEFAGRIVNPRYDANADTWAGYTSPDSAHVPRDCYGNYATTPQYTSTYPCCRCRFAIAWFYTGKEKADLKLWHADGSLAWEVAPDGGQLVARVRTEGGRSVAFAKAWPNRPEIDPCHIGWHAGLRRPTFRENDYGHSARQGLDAYGVTAGTSRLSGLCDCCRAIIPTIPQYLFWVARGWSVGQAKQIAAWEAAKWKPGRIKDRVDIGVLDVLDHLPWR